MTSLFAVEATYAFAVSVDQEVRALLTALAEASRREPGNVAYEVGQDLNDDRLVRISELYKDRDAFGAIGGASTSNALPKRNCCRC